MEITKERKKYKRLSEEERNTLYESFITGEYTKAELSRIYNISPTSVANNISLVEFNLRNQDSEEIIKPPMPIGITGRFIIEEEEPRFRKERKNMRKRKNKSLNKHQRRKAIQKMYDAMKDNTIDNEQKEYANSIMSEITPTEIKLGLVDIDPAELGIILLEKSNSSYEFGLIADRHDIYDVNDYLFTESLNEDMMFDYDKQLDICKEFINKNTVDGQTLVCYCTGYQSALLSLVKAALETKRNLICKHYNSQSKQYISQVVIDNYGDLNPIFPLNRLIKRGPIYTYSCNLKEITEAKEFYCISLNKHNKDTNSIEETTYIICLKMSDGWKLLQQLYEKMENPMNQELNLSILMASMTIENDSAIWGKNIAKSFSFK